MGRRLIAPLALLLAVACPGLAAAAPRWQPPQTLDLVRGVPAPQVAIDGGGNGYMAYSTADRPFSDTPQVKLAVRRTDDSWRPAWTLKAGATDVKLAVNPVGTAAVAAIEAGHLYVTVFNGPLFSRPTTVPVGPAGAGARDPDVAVDGVGRTTVTWTSALSADGVALQRQVRAATISPLGEQESVQTLATSSDCRPVLDVNLRGDAAVAVRCAGLAADFFYRQAGGAFGPGHDVFDSTGDVGVSLDGTGNVHAYRAAIVQNGSGKSVYEVQHAFKPAAGSFGVPQHMPQVQYFDSGFDLEAFEDGRVLAAWSSPGDVAAFTLGVAGQAFGPVRHIASRGVPYGLDVAASTLGPGLISWREERSLGVEQPAAALIAPDGSATTSRLGIAGDLGSPRDAPLAFAVNDAGQAAAAWEQRCSKRGPWAVMAIARDETRSDTDPPCQDRRAPKAIAVQKRAVARGRTLLVRIACDERCWFTASARLLRQGIRKPIATAKTRSERRLAARRGGWARLPLSAAELRRVDRAHRRGSEITARLAISVRDAYGNGRRWRIAVPVRR